VFEPNRPGTGNHLLTISVEDVGFAMPGDCLFQSSDAEVDVFDSHPARTLRLNQFMMGTRWRKPRRIGMWVSPGLRPPGEPHRQTHRRRPPEAGCAIGRSGWHARRTLSQFGQGFSPLSAASATFALNAGEWLPRGLLVMISPVRGHNGHRQAENPLTTVQISRASSVS
jgi:hypothetical protein